MFEPIALIRQAAECHSILFQCCLGGSTGTKSTTKKQRSNREKHPHRKQFLFHYATLKDIMLG